MSTDQAWDRLFEGRPVSEPTDHDRAIPDRSRGRRHGRAASAKRLDIQGLRMVAVVAVVANHLTGKPAGGFVGVDVFFVISGYLMTNMLLRSGVRSGGAGSMIGDFYLRRIRRLLPAAFVVTAATIVVAQFAFYGARAHSTLVDGLWASAFWANWHFIAVGTNYFAAQTPESPFQHYWSLSVEEQFYLVWPLLMFIVAVIATRLHRSLRPAAGVLSVLFCAASLAVAFPQSQSDPIRAYFSTFTRAWELGLGALLACVVPRLRAGTLVLTVMSWLGLALIGVALFTVNGGAGFPVPAAILPCVGSALVVAANSPNGQVRNWLLTNRVSTFIGDISYSLYLVHFPVIILIAAKMPNRGPYFYGAAVLLALAGAVGLYGLVERPVLDSRFLRPPSQRDIEREDSGSTRMFALAAAIAGVAAMSAFALWPGTQSALNQKYAEINSAPAQAAPNDTSGPAPVAVGPRQKVLSAEIVAALQAQSWPSLHPTVQQAISAPEAPPDIAACADVKPLPAVKCTWGAAHATHIAYVAGDSTSMVYMQAYRDIATKILSGWAIRFIGAAGCDFDSVLINNNDPAIQNGCAQHNREVVSEIKAAKPDLLLVTNTYRARPAASDNHVLSDGEWTTALQQELAQVAGSARKVVIVSPPPDGLDITNCYDPSSSPVQCVAKIPGRWASRAHAEAALAAAHHYGYVDPSAWFCSANGYCPPFVGHNPVQHEAAHVATSYLDTIYPVMAEAMQARGVFS